MSGGAQRRVADVLARVGAAVGLIQTYSLPVRQNCGPPGRWWETVRRNASRLLGRFFDERAGPRPITEGEYAGSLPMSLGEAEQVLWRQGFVRNPFSRLKTRDDDAEIGSWVHREYPLARRQLHVMLFPGDDGVDVYAHDELSSANPLVGTGHFNGTSQRVATGVRQARRLLPLDVPEDATEAQPGPWESQPSA